MHRNQWIHRDRECFRVARTNLGAVQILCGNRNCGGNWCVAVVDGREISDVARSTCCQANRWIVVAPGISGSG